MILECCPGVSLANGIAVLNRYKKPDERQPLVAAMHIFMPMLKDRFIQLLPDPSSDSVLVQKQIFKIIYALFQVLVLHFVTFIFNAYLYVCICMYMCVCVRV